MAVLYAGTSLADFYITGTAIDKVLVNLGLGALEGIRFNNGSAANRGVLTYDIAPSSDFWLSFYWYNDSNVTSGANYDWVGFYNKAYSTTTPLLKIQADASTGVFTIRYWNGTAFVTDNIVPNMFNVGLRRFDIHIVISDTVGKFDVYENSTKIAGISITDTNLFASTIDMIRNSQYKANLSLGINYVSSLMVMDEDTRNYEFFQRNTNANGDETAWSGTYTDVTKSGIDDSTLIISNTPGQIETYQKNALPPQYADSVVAAVVLATRARSSDVGIDGVARIGGVNYVHAPEAPVLTVFGPHMINFAVNPATGLPWSISAINSAQFGVKST